MKGTKNMTHAVTSLNKRAQFTDKNSKTGVKTSARTVYVRGPLSTAKIDHKSGQAEPIPKFVRASVVFS